MLATEKGIKSVTDVDILQAYDISGDLAPLN